jgi:hypothetical protein
MDSDFIRESQHAPTETTMRTCSIALIATSLASLFITPAYALRANTYVASYGADNGSCSYTAPCRTFAFALNAVEPGGVVTAIDSAGNSPFTISKAVTIAAPAGVSPLIAVSSGGTAITINAGQNDAVTLQGLTIDGAGVGATGIALSSAGSLTIENCIVRNLTSSGLALGPSLSISGTTNILISHTLVANNGGHGIYVQPSGGGVVTAVFNHVEAVNNAQTGIGIFGNLGGGFVLANVADSISASNGAEGFLAFTTAGHSFTRMFVVRSTATRNGDNGLSVDGSGALLYFSQSTVTMNSGGISDANGGQLWTYQDNNIDLNHEDVFANPLHLVGRQ